MALQQATTATPADRYKNVWIIQEAWKGSQTRALDQKVRFSDAVNRLIHEVVEGNIDIDPREDSGRGSGRGKRGIYPDPDDWAKFQEFADTKGLSCSRALELLMMRYKRGDFMLKAVIEFRETRGIKRGVTREPEESAA